MHGRYCVHHSQEWVGWVWERAGSVQDPEEGASPGNFMCSSWELLLDVAFGQEPFS